MDNKLTICEKSRANTEELLRKLSELEECTQEEVDFLIERAIESAKIEIALAALMNGQDSQMSELAQKIAEQPGFKFEKKVIFEDSTKNDISEEEFKIVEAPEITEAGIEVEAKRKPCSKKRRKKILLVSQKLDECEIYVMASRLTERDVPVKAKLPERKFQDEMSK